MLRRDSDDETGGVCTSTCDDVHSAAAAAADEDRLVLADEDWDEQPYKHTTVDSMSVHQVLCPSRCVIGTEWQIRVKRPMF